MIIRQSKDRFSKRLQTFKLHCQIHCPTYPLFCSSPSARGFAPAYGAQRLWDTTYRKTRAMNLDENTPRRSFDDTESPCKQKPFLVKHIKKLLKISSALWPSSSHDLESITKCEPVEIPAALLLTNWCHILMQCCTCHRSKNGTASHELSFDWRQPQ